VISLFRNAIVGKEEAKPWVSMGLSVGESLELAKPARRTDSHLLLLS
jgi:hypothetical protein